MHGQKKGQPLRLRYDLEPLSSVKYYLDKTDISWQNIREISLKLKCAFYEFLEHCKTHEKEKGEGVRFSEDNEFIGTSTRKDDAIRSSARTISEHQLHAAEE